MPTLEELDVRTTALEDQVSNVERQCVGIDQKLSDLTVKVIAQHGLIEALAKTQSEHTATLRRHTTILDRHTTILDRHSAILDQHTAILDQHTVKLDLLEGGVNQILAMLTTLVDQDGESPEV
jgi:hypothetical protein